MPFSAKIVLDSQHPTGARLTTMECTYPRFIHAEIMTHRMFSRNSASSRAIPVEKLLAQVRDNPVIPLHWGRNQPGMQARAELSGPEAEECRARWLAARDRMVEQVEALLALNLHKQIANRLLEPWMWITVIITATEWSNFFAQRCHPEAEPHMQRIATLMRTAYDQSRPRPLSLYDWHTPYASDLESLTWFTRTSVSTARCARVSYLNHDGVADVDKDLKLYDKLKTAGHWSPFEHVAQAVPAPDSQPRSNFHPSWRQFRKMFAEECR